MQYLDFFKEFLRQIIFTIINKSSCKIFFSFSNNEYEDEDETTTQKSDASTSTTIKSTTSPKLDGEVACQILPPYQDVEGMLKWCNDNCRLGNCQNEICNCS